MPELPGEPARSVEQGAQVRGAQRAEPHPGANRRSGGARRVLRQTGEATQCKPATLPHRVPKGTEPNRNRPYLPICKMLP